MEALFRLAELGESAWSRAVAGVTQPVAVERPKNQSGDEEHDLVERPRNRQESKRYQPAQWSRNTAVTSEDLHCLDHSSCDCDHSSQPTRPAFWKEKGPSTGRRMSRR